ncbi:reticulon-like protein B21 isoform X1 [Spinacia oleracea]|uniref:Reticulon-like protein n=1 Tax=Spinacia oleracea TaxID=3562 RepID=A0A9R0HUW8_SPIOL|nr:reticulon-like protein B21 isoform X1 [Spinacia oleracea]XP_056692325.1 reticulon-like protein B21 isoform X1 [Spinacia oleracea]
MESGKRKMTTTRRTLTKTGSLNTGGRRHTPINVINDQVVQKPKHLQLGVAAAAKRKTSSSSVTPENSQLHVVQQQLQEDCITDSNCKQTSIINLRSPVQVLKKTRSEPFKVSSSIDSELRKVNSENWTNSNSPNQSPTNVAAKKKSCDSDQHQQQALILLMDSNKTQNLCEEEDEEEELFTDKIKQSSDYVKVEGTEEEVEVSPMVIRGHVDHSLEVEGTEEVEVSPMVIRDHVDHSIEIEGKGKLNKSVHDHDKLIKLDISDESLTYPKKNKTRKVGSQLSSTCTSVSALVSSSTSNSTKSGCKREALNEYDISGTPSKFQTLVDLVTWRDVSKSAFIFGFGSFIIISSSFTKDFNFSLISVASYLSLISLAVVFLYKSFMSRYLGVMGREDWPENNVWGEEEAIWFVKMVLPYLNEFVLQLRGLFSGDPAMTMKLAVVLFVLARCGGSITIWKMLKLGFFGVFVVPKLCSSYSAQITAYAKFWVGRFRDVWESCSHKKAVALSVFTVVWNFSSTVARAWAAFMLFVAFRYYQQSLITDDFIEVKEQTQTGLHNVQRRRHSATHRCTVPTCLDQKKQNKSN